MGWFVIKNEVVTGPFSTEELLELKSLNEIDSENSYVWGKQINQWLTFKTWESSYESILSNSNKRAQAKIQTWYYAKDSKSKPVGPFAKEVLIEKVKELEAKDKVLVWTKGMTAWASLFEFNDILNELNISRRKHPRAPIDGQITLKSEDGQAFIGRINVISPGGCGISQVDGLIPGDLYQIEIKSDAFYNPLSAVGLVLREIGKNKYGIRFEKIHIESESTIISYLKDNGYIKQNKEAA